MFRRFTEHGNIAEGNSMSTQAGVWNYDGRPLDRELLDRMAISGAQYGPDGGDLYLSDSLGMVYGAFHTTKESRLERQPHCSSRGNAMTWDGRLDNREDLLAQLSDYLPAKPTDSEIVLAAYEHWGTNCFHRMVGDWATAIWDRKEQILILAIDYIAVRHLYYQQTSRQLIWCSHLAPLVLNSQTQLSLNEKYVAGYFAFYPQPDVTPYCEIASVPPGHFIRFHKDQKSFHAFWSLNFSREIRYKTDREYEDQFLHLFRQAVRRRLRSDKPILAELSGGLDSSSIVCLADDIISKGEVSVPELDTISFFTSGEPEADERQYFSQVEQKRGRVGRHIDQNEREHRSFSAPRTFFPAPGPLFGSDSDPNESVQDYGYRVVLSGLGGDELLGGVPDPRAQLADMIVQFRLVALARYLKAWSLTKRRPWIQLMYQALIFLLPDALQPTCTHGVPLPKWIDPRFVRRNRMVLRHSAHPSAHYFRLPSRRDAEQTYLGLSHEMACEQPKLEACEEKRYPFLDQELVEFLLTIPAAQLLRPGERRSLMRRALRSYLPPGILSRPNKGYSARQWMVAARCYLNDHNATREGFVGSDVGYMDHDLFVQELHATANGITSDLIRTLRALGLELWFQNLKAHAVALFPAADSQHGKVLVHERA